MARVVAQQVRRSVRLIASYASRLEALRHAVHLLMRITDGTFPSWSVDTLQHIVNQKRAKKRGFDERVGWTSIKVICYVDSPRPSGLGV